MAYHLQTNGQSEHANQHVEQYLCIYGNTEQDDWASLLPMVQFMHNSWVNDSTQTMPFILLHSHTLTLWMMSHETNLPTLAWWQEWLLAVCTRAQGAIKHAQCLLEGRTECKKGQRHYHGYKQGDQVWLEGRNLWLSHPTAKLAPK